MKQWFALYTKSNWEKKVVTTLSSKGVESYCPLNKVVSVWSDRRKIIYKPLFSSYVFVKASIHELWMIREIPGAVYIVSWKGKPAVIQDREMEGIQNFLREHESLKVSKVPLQINDSVKVTGGPLIERHGVVIDLNEKRVKILLPSLGFSMVAEIAKEHIALAGTRGAIQIPAN